MWKKKEIIIKETLKGDLLKSSSQCLCVVQVHVESKGLINSLCCCMAEEPFNFHTFQIIWSAFANLMSRLSADL